MSKHLATMLQTAEPLLRAGIQQLERANGHPQADIRLAADSQQALRVKISQLGLDPTDTTGPELYGALLSRLSHDEKALTRKLRTLAASHVSAEADVVAGMAYALGKQFAGSKTFSLKSTSLNRLLKSHPPKKAMKQLGYRSLDSCLKHETPQHLLAAAWLVETEAWRTRFSTQYHRLSARDFETRQLVLFRPNDQRWRSLVMQAVNSDKHNVLAFKELGMVMLLPLPADAPNGSVTASFSLAVQAVNEVLAAGAYLELCQVRADFGDTVCVVAAGEPALASQLFNRPLSWQLIHRQRAQQPETITVANDNQLHLSPARWQSVEQVLASVEPTMNFWLDTAHLGFLHQQRAISCNVIDMALSLCNRLPLEAQASHHFRRSLWHELLLRYLQPAAIEQAIGAEIQPQLTVGAAI